MKHGYLTDPGGSLKMHIILTLHVPPLPTLHTLDCQAFSLQEAKLQSVTSGGNSLGATEKRSMQQRSLAIAGSRIII